MKWYFTDNGWTGVLNSANYSYQSHSVMHSGPEWNKVCIPAKQSIRALFTCGLINFCTDKNLHGSTLRLHGTGRTGRIFQRLSVQVWDLLFSGPKHAPLAVQKFVHLRRSRVNARKVELCKILSVQKFVTRVNGAPVLK